MKKSARSGGPQCVSGAAAIALILAGSALLFWPVLSFQFVYDDSAFVVSNPRLASLSQALRALQESVWAFDPNGDRHYYRPLLVLWMASGRYLFGTNPAGLHAASLALHLVATWLVWRLGGTLGVSRLGSLVAAGLFALHPAQIQAVAWVSAVNDPLLAVMILGATVLWIDGRRLGDRRRFAAAVGSFAAATLVVERAIPSPSSRTWWSWTCAGTRARGLCAHARSERRRTSPYYGIESWRRRPSSCAGWSSVEALPFILVVLKLRRRSRCCLGRSRATRPS